MKPSDIKILGVTVTYNNEDKIPYVMPYYERIGIDKLVVYDNGSTDKTVEMLNKYPFVEVRSYITDKYDEGKVLELKTKIQDEFAGQYNWCISTYFDEVFYSERDFREVLYEKMTEGKTYFLKTGLNIFSRTFPPADNGKLIHENVGRGSLWTSDDGIIGIFGNKVELFDMQKLYVTYDSKGCHECRFSGVTAPFEEDIAFFHLKFIDFDFIIKSNEIYKQRTEGTGINCYNYFSENMERVYDLMEKRAISVEKYMSTPMDKLMPQQVLFLVKETDQETQKQYVDKAKECSDNGFIQQYGILFYGISDESYDDIWYYSINKHMMSFVNNEQDDPESALQGFTYLLGTTVKPEPWVVEMNGISDFSFEFFDNFERQLPVLNEKGLREGVIDGHKFVKYKRFLSTNPETTLGCYMIVKNEEKSIGKCLSSIIDLCDEVVVVDTGCSDKTMDIAKSYGEKVKCFNFEWRNDFSAARNFAMSKIKSDYSFTTDADEEFSSSLKERILHLKEDGFHGADSCEMWLINCNGTVDPPCYLGGRQIVKMGNGNTWKYKVHEKLYFNKDTSVYVPISDGYIIHRHINNTSESNYNKYAEIYYNELNGGDFLSVGKSAHFFYYMFLTLKGIDNFAAKLYLYEAFKKKRIAVDNENIMVHLLRDGYISLEEFTAMNAIANPNGIEYFSALGDALNEPLAKYILLKKATEYGERLSEDGIINLAYISYQNALIKDFVQYTEFSNGMAAESPIISHNMAFCNTYVKPAMEKSLIIDCTDGTKGLASNFYYFSKIFKNIRIKCNKVEDLKYFNTYGADVIESPITGEDALFVNGNEQMTPAKAVQIFQNFIYGDEKK